MANVPFPLTGTTTDDIRPQVYELIRDLYENKIGGADLGDVFSLPGEVLTLVLATPSGLTKTNKMLAVQVTSDGGLQILSTGMLIKIVSTGGLQTNASGLGIKLDGASLTLSAAGLKVTPGATDYLGKFHGNPTSYTEGDRWYDLDAHVHKSYDGTNIIIL